MVVFGAVQAVETGTIDPSRYALAARRSPAVFVLAERSVAVGKGRSRYGALLHPLSSAGPGHPTDWRQPKPGKITVQSGAQRHPEDVSAASALDGDLPRLKTGAPGGWLLPAQARTASVTAADR
jgi:hypothetical protein